MTRGRGGRAAATVVVVTACLSWPVVAAAADRPSEADLFGGASAGADGGAPASAAAATGGGDADGGPPSVSPAAPVAPIPATAPPSSVADPAAAPSRDDAVLGDPKAGPKLSVDVAPDDPLRIGGQLYLRAAAQATQGQALGSIRASAPALVDAYFDARPNDRVRAFVLGRLFFDPTLPTTGAPLDFTSSMSGTSVSTATAVPLLSGTQSTRGPNSVLDQMWLRFDVKRTLFITAGRQHVKWGTGRFWTPTDYLHPQRRNPVAAFDARPGFTMLKVHAPWEERGWNFYAFGLVEGTPVLDSTGRYPAGSDGASTLGRMGGAARAELVLGTAELGLDAVVYHGQKPRFGGDLSFGIGDFDLYVDAGLRYGSELPRRGYDPSAVDDTTKTLVQRIDARYPYEPAIGVKPQVTVGGTYQLRYNDNDVFTVTGEYFYNSRGYNDPRVYPGLFLTNTFEFFYTGRHYAALGAILAAPWSWNYTTFSFTTLGNLSDQSFISRLDYSLVLLTHLRFEAFGAVNYGRREGEFRLGVKEITVPDPLVLGGTRTIKQEPQSFSVGLGLRVSL
ncbi:MAG: hypothetical protein ABUL77_04155 [Bacteroidota bacterium]